MPDLSRSRPHVANVFCLHCQKPVDNYAQSGLHCAGWTLPGFEHLAKGAIDGPMLSGEGLIIIQAECHGQTCSAGIPFDAIKPGKPNRIELFGDKLTIDGVEPVMPANFDTFWEPETGCSCDVSGDTLLGPPKNASPELLAKLEGCFPCRRDDYVNVVLPYLRDPAKLKGWRPNPEWLRLGLTQE